MSDILTQVWINFRNTLQRKLEITVQNGNLGAIVGLLIVAIFLAVGLVSHLIKRSKSKGAPEVKSKEINSAPRSSSGLTPMDLINKRFAPTKFREGYSQHEVDNFLDRVVLELKRLQGENKELKRRRANTDTVIGPIPLTIVTADEVVEQSFSLTKGSGYDTDEVDDFLDEIAFELRRLNAENQELADQIVAIVEEAA
jgi:DivIVA domain-containing protein